MKPGLPAKPVTLGEYAENRYQDCNSKGRHHKAINISYPINQKRAKTYAHRLDTGGRIKTAHETLQVERPDHEKNSSHEAGLTKVHDKTQDCVPGACPLQRPSARQSGIAKQSQSR